MNIYIKLQEARVKLQAMNLKKTGENKFAGFKYYDLGDILPSVNTILSEFKLCSILTFNQEMATLTIINAENVEEKIEFTSPLGSLSLKGAHDIQNLGGVQTYLKRYLYMNAFEIVEHDELDATLGKKEATNKTTITEAQLKRLLAIGNKKGVTKEGILKVVNTEYGLNDLMQLNKEQYDAIVTRIEKK